MIGMAFLLAALAFSTDGSGDQQSQTAATKARPATPKSDITKLFGLSNYPAAARAQRLEGRNTFVLTVDAQGMVVGCAVTASSGHRELDDGSCRTARRLRFDPARDERGRRIVSEFPMQADWRLGTG